ncbi:MAG: hypothetical protein HQL13_04580, partial [Candidatus Omnitrophica bacterium]|nr:hypothetical protein [Candidatus Omnitrophota bacterium]
MARFNFKKKAQAAIELAIFGAILVFVLGSIIRTAIGNSYSQNTSFWAMRMAMAKSWESSLAVSTSRSSASVTIIEDRLSPDVNKYGALERNAIMGAGGGTLSYQLMYPIEKQDAQNMMPMMDMYINGQYFPFTTAGFSSYTPTRPSSCAMPPTLDPPFSAAVCQALQQCRRYYEWRDQAMEVHQSQFTAIAPITGANTAACNAWNIFNNLVNYGMLVRTSSATSSCTDTSVDQAGTVAQQTLSSNFIQWYQNFFPGTDQVAQLAQITNLLQNKSTQYPLFFGQVVNKTGTLDTAVSGCSSHPCKDGELSDIKIGGVDGSDVQFDLLRIYGTSTSVQGQQIIVPSNLRPYMNWKWAATAGINPDMIGLDAKNNQYAQYDVDGRLKTVTIYDMNGSTVYFV